MTLHFHVTKTLTVSISNLRSEFFLLLLSIRICTDFYLHLCFCHCDISKCFPVYQDVAVPVCSLKPAKYFTCLCVCLSSVSFAVLCRCSVESVIVRRPQNAHHPGRPGCADQRCDHPPLRLGHLPTHTGGPQAAPTLLPGPPQRHRLPPVSVCCCFSPLNYSSNIKKSEDTHPTCLFFF